MNQHTGIVLVGDRLTSRLWHIQRVPVQCERVVRHSTRITDEKHDLIDGKGNLQ